MSIIMPDFETPPTREEIEAVKTLGPLDRTAMARLLVPAPKWSDYMFSLARMLEWPEVLKSRIMSHDNVTPAKALWARGWARCGAPQVQPGHKLAASLCCTMVPPDIAQDLAASPPWPYWCILVPDRMVSAPNDPEVFATHILVGPQHFQVCYGLSCTIPMDLSLLFEEGASPRVAVLQTLHRLTIGCLLELGTARHREAIGRGRVRNVARTKRREHDLPTAWSYLLTRDIKVDCREYVQRHLGGARGPVSVQCMVAGHWKWQACGVGRADRRRIHVEPYWRGPEDAPIAVRRHVL